jgi:hypothetical protein
MTRKREPLEWCTACERFRPRKGMSPTAAGYACKECAKEIREQR